MKFKDLNAIIANPGNKEKLAGMAQIELEAEIFRLMKEEKKYNKNKFALIAKTYTAIEIIDQIKPDFVAEGSKELRALYFRGLALKEKPVKEVPVKKSSSHFHLLHSLKSSHYTRQDFKGIGDINAFLLNILNNEVLTVTEGEYLQIRGKKQYKISAIEDEINKQIKQILKETPIDKNKVLSSIQCILYMNRMVPAFLHRAHGTTKDNLQKCIDVINEDIEFSKHLKELFNAKAREVNKGLFVKYNQIDSTGTHSENENWYVGIVTNAFTRPVVEINANKELVDSLLEIMTLSRVLNLKLDDSQLKGQGFIPVLEDGSKPIEEDYLAFMQQTISINFEIKLRGLADRYRDVSNKLAQELHHGIKEKQTQEERMALYKEKEQIEVEFDTLRSVPLSNTCFSSMLAHRNSLAQRIGYELSDEESNGSVPSYFSQSSMGNKRTAMSCFIPKCVSVIKYFLNEINYSIEYTQKRHAILDYTEKYLDLSYMEAHLSEQDITIHHIIELEEELAKHRATGNHKWAGERHMRCLLAQLIPWCQLVDIELDLPAIDEGKSIHLEDKLSQALEYPGFGVLQANIESLNPSHEAIESFMSFWPEEWKTQYQEDLASSSQLKAM